MKLWYELFNTYFILERFFQKVHLIKHLFRVVFRIHFSFNPWRKSFIFFSACEGAEFNKSCNLIGRWSEQNFPIRTAIPIQRAEFVEVIHFRERISGYRQSFGLFTLLL